MSRSTRFGRRGAGAMLARETIRALAGRRRLGPVEVLAMVAAAALVGLIASYVAPVDEIVGGKEYSRVLQVVEARFANCNGGAQPYCVIDGDTVRIGGEKVRIADIDTPEVFSPKCASEFERGNAATRRLTELLNAGPIEVIRAGSQDEDFYGRKLRVLARDGQSLGAVLVAEGHARRWDGARRSWCA